MTMITNFESAQIRATDKLDANTAAFNSVKATGIRGNVLNTTPGEYHVYPGAFNDNRQFSTIQAAIDQAVADGYTTFDNQATVFVHPAGGHVYTGVGPSNVITLPITVSLFGMSNNSYGQGVFVNARVNVVNNIPLVYNPKAIGYVANICFLQTSATQPCMYYANYTNNFAMLNINRCFFIALNPAATAPLLDVNGPLAFAYLYQVQVGSFSGAPCVHAGDGAWFNIFQAGLIGNKFLLVDGFPSPIQDIYVDGCVMYADNQLLIPVDFETELIRINSPVPICRIQRCIFQTQPFPGSVKKQRGLVVGPGVPAINVIMYGNLFQINPNAGVDNLTVEMPNVPGVQINHDSNPVVAGTVSAKSAGNYVPMASAF